MRIRRRAGKDRVCWPAGEIEAFTDLVDIHSGIDDCAGNERVLASHSDLSFGIVS